jgi:hypothetical protein
MRAFRIPVLALASLLMVFLPARARAQTPAPTGPKTEVHVYEPYNGDVLNSDLNVTGSVTGSCDAPSQVDVNRADAWACTVAYKVYDPCFANADASELACPDLPAIGSGTMSEAKLLSVVRVKPSEPLDPTLANTPGPDATPFLIELTDGQFCVPEPANVTYASLPVFGWCTAGYWFGPGDLSQALWTLPILQGGATPTISSIVNIGIQRLWY